jgi:hypothetical protein
MDSVSERLGTTNFAHESEREFAGFLDFYDIEWRYEPTCFPLERDEADVSR